MPAFLYAIGTTITPVRSSRNSARVSIVEQDDPGLPSRNAVKSARGRARSVFEDWSRRNSSGFLPLKLLASSSNPAGPVVPSSW
jgi:hypothetical protein